MKSIRKLVALLTLTTLLLTSLSLTSTSEAQDSAPGAPGLVVVESTQSFDDTWSTLLAALEANPNISVIAQVNHAAAAATIGTALDGNAVVFFGNPNLGTPIMQANRTAGIDLPQKMQVIEQDGRVFVTYNPPAYVAARHATGSVGTLATIEGALAGLASTAANVDSSATFAASQAAPVAGAGLVTTTSANDFETTWSNLTSAINASPASIAFTVDHGANSGGALPPTRLVVFGNPSIGTPMMQSSATAGVDLPLKMLVFEDDDGITHVVSTSPSFVQSRHGVGDVPTVAAATNAIRNFTSAATTAPPAEEEPDEQEATTGTESTESSVPQLALTGSNPIIAWFAITLLGTGGTMVLAGRRDRRTE